MKLKWFHIYFKLRIGFIYYRRRFLHFLELTIIPILLFASLLLLIFVSIEAIDWYHAAATLEDEEQIKAKNEIIRTLAQILGGGFVLLGVYFTAKNVSVEKRGQMTDRFSEALNCISEENSLVKRIGGIHTLESIALESSKDHWRIIEIFSGYVRDFAPINSEKKEANRNSQKAKINSDIQQVMDAIGRRNGVYKINETRKIDLSNVNLEGVDLRSANLEGINFRGANLKGANLFKAHLKNADFTNANLDNSNLNYSDLTNTNFHNASINDAQFRNSLLINTSFSMASIRNASFEECILKKVKFPNSNLSNSTFEDSKLSWCLFFNTNLNSVNLAGALIEKPVGMMQSQFNSTITNDKTKLIGELK